MTAHPDACELQKAQKAKYNHFGYGYEENRYSALHMELYGEIRNSEIARALEEYHAADQLDVLEVGCGTGLTLEFLSELNPRHKLVGLDLSAVMLGQAKARMKQRPTQHLILGSSYHLPFASETFDAVVATRFMHLFGHEDKKRIHAEFLRVLRPGGVAIVEYYGRLFALVRFYIMGERRCKKKEAFFSHYPLMSEVREIVGCPFELRPVRLVGTRVLYDLLGRDFVSWLTLHAAVPGLNVFADEYLVVTQKPRSRAAC